LGFVGRSEVIHCIAPFAYALKHLYEVLVYISLTEVIHYLNMMLLLYQIIISMFNQIVI